MIPENGSKAIPGTGSGGLRGGLGPWEGLLRGRAAASGAPWITSVGRPGPAAPSSTVRRRGVLQPAAGPQTASGSAGAGSRCRGSSSRQLAEPSA